MVFDLNKCLGCQSCSIACKTLWTDGPGMESMWWNIVNTMPGGGTPRDVFSHGGGYRDGQPVPGKFPAPREYGEAWDFDQQAVFSGSERIPLHPRERDGSTPSWGPNWDEDLGGGVYPDSFFFYLQQICANCSKPACLEACPREGLYRREEDGIILIDEERCNGYRFCAEACPYKRIYFNPTRRLSQKCVLCFARVEQGVAPACMRQCPGRVRFFGYLDDKKSAVHKLVKTWKVAIPLHPEFGTEPNLFYVPPLAPPRLLPNGDVDEDNPRIPKDYLEWLFGPAVWPALDTLKGEIAKRQNGEPSELLDTLIAFQHKDMFGGFTKDPSTLDRKPRHVDTGQLFSPGTRRDT
jgi:ethylbenzene hydroxylase subunit beta/complex iron-sulfur molybdoenzyme family reductase subunit beta